MNQEALDKSQATGKVIFTASQGWTKGEESGHFLLLKAVKVDCDRTVC
jgi:phosphoribosyl-ATP pyrophosphohydrolase/phosphoribosyl-AMP cyclohydrolase